MGWTFTAMQGIKPKEVKGVVDSMIRSDAKVVKSVMVGNTYYAAVEFRGTTTGLVVKTSIRNSEYCNFGTKFIGEEEGPCERECPNSILNLLSPTDSDWANQWRDKCRAFNDALKNLKKLPIGSKVETSKGDVYYKNRDHGRYQWFTAPGGIYYIPAKRIAEAGYSVLSEGGAA